MSNITADIAHSFGGSGLSNTFERLVLAAGSTVIDDAACSVEGKWCAGSASPQYASMERIDPAGSGSDPVNWCTNDGVTVNGTDAGGNPVNGTPKAHNSCAN